MNNYNNVIKIIEKKLIPDTKKLQDFRSLLASFEEYEKVVFALRGDITTKQSNQDLVEDATQKSKILEPLNKFYNEYNETLKQFNDSKIVKEVYDFFEQYRTYRTYYLNENILERFISDFLSNFAEDFTFKTEFIGQIDLNKFADTVKGTKDNSIVKIKFIAIPKTIKEAYNLNLKKFIIESHNLKLLFRENYMVEITSNSNMIHKIDKVARENKVNYK